MRKSLLYTTTILSGLALATAAGASSHTEAKPDVMKPSTSEMNKQMEKMDTDKVGSDNVLDRSNPAPSNTAVQQNAGDNDGTFRSFNRTGKLHGGIAGGYTADELIGTNVVDANGETVGEISDLLIAADDTVSSVLIDVGGFLGIGEKQVALDLSDLTRDGDNIRTSMTEEQLESRAAYREEGENWVPAVGKAQRKAAE